jgi:hypothetical protein
MKLQTYNIKGERCSGTNYLQKLIEINLGVPYKDDIGWKHGWCGYFNKNEKLLKSFLTIIIFRNPFDWLRSLYLIPHHIKGTKDSIWEDPKPTFSEFIRSESIETIEIEHSLLLSRHPFYLTNPKNILELRKWKIEYFLNLKNVLPHTYYLKYEDLNQDPEKIITEINNKYFNIDFEFKNWTRYKTEDEKYVPKKYFDISEDDYSYLVENIDWELESKIDYGKSIEILAG